MVSWVKKRSMPCRAISRQGILLFFTHETIDTILYGQMGSFFDLAGKINCLLNLLQSKTHSFSLPEIMFETRDTICCIGRSQAYQDFCPFVHGQVLLLFFIYKTEKTSERVH